MTDDPRAGDGGVPTQEPINDELSWLVEYAHSLPDHVSERIGATVTAIRAKLAALSAGPANMKGGDVNEVAERKRPQYVEGGVTHPPENTSAGPATQEYRGGTHDCRVCACVWCQHARELLIPKNCSQSAGPVLSRETPLSEAIEGRIVRLRHRADIYEQLSKGRNETDAAERMAWAESFRTCADELAADIKAAALDPSAPAVARPQEWHPIETCPVDVDVLVVGGSCGDSAGVASQRPRGDWASDEGTPFVEPPTHWMPLPDPPSARVPDQEPQP